MPAFAKFTGEMHFKNIDAKQLLEHLPASLKDKNGVITTEAVKLIAKSMDAPLDRIFEVVDTNKSGDIDKAEIDAIKAKMGDILKHQKPGGSGIPDGHGIPDSLKVKSTGTVISTK